MRLTKSTAYITAFVQSPVKQCIFLFCLGFIVRLGFNIANDAYLISTNIETHHIARAIVRGDGFSNPFGALPTGPSAHLAPGYSGLLAGVYLLCGDGVTGLFIADAINSAISSAVGALLPVAALLCGTNPVVAFFAGVFYAILPPQPFTESKGDWEAAIGALLLILAFTSIRRQIDSPELTIKKALSVGLLSGLTCLFLPTLCPVIVGFLVILFWYKGGRLSGLPCYGLTVVIVTLALIGPWLIRNRLVFGQFVPIRDNFGLELRLSYRDKAAASLAENIQLGNHNQLHPNGSVAECVKIRALGEVEYNHGQMKVATDWIRGHPRQFIELTLRHFQLFWTSGIRFVLLVPFAIWGMVRVWKQNRPSFCLLSVIFALQPPFYYLTQFAPRYRHPIEWAVTTAAFIGLAAIIKSVLRGQDNKEHCLTAECE